VLVSAREASLAFEIKFVPVDLAIVGVVDELEVADGGDAELKAGQTRYS
jgi:microcompartment protein CcmK/EutM